MLLVSGLKNFEEGSHEFASQITLDASGASAFSCSRIFIRGRFDQCRHYSTGASRLRSTTMPAAGVDVDAWLLGLRR
jgi:hypothetical protein